MILWCQTVYWNFSLDFNKQENLLKVGYIESYESEVWLENLMPSYVNMSNSRSDQVTFHLLG